MPDSFLRDHTVVYAIIAAFTAVTTFIGTVVWGRRRLKLDEQSALSTSEKEFRVAILARLRDVETANAACEKRDHERAQENLRLQAEVDDLRDEIAKLRERQAQRDLPLTGRVG